MWCVRVVLALKGMSMQTARPTVVIGLTEADPPGRAVVLCVDEKSQTKP